MARLVKSDRTLGRARRLRAEMTDAERILWMLLRNRRFADFKFRRQAPLGDYVVDFVCLPGRLVVELDGAQHARAQAAFDAARTTYLAGFRVLRVWTRDLFADREAVMSAIIHALRN
jgi:very-short-patch-repair endonuclease